MTLNADLTTEIFEFIALRSAAVSYLCSQRIGRARRRFRAVVFAEMKSFVISVAMFYFLRINVLM